ncbi:MAG: VanW family protein [Bacillota bacterium]|nr:VanW family protein [Bacillota bacterium]
MKKYTKQSLSWALIRVLTFSFLILLIEGCTPPSSHPSETKTISNPIAENQESGKIDRIPTETKVDDLDLSGIPTSEVGEKVEEWSKDKLEETRILLYNKTRVPITLKDIGIELDQQKTIGDIWRNLGAATPSVLKVDKVKAKQALQEKLKPLNRPAKDASYKIENDKFLVIPAKNGQTVDIDRMMDDIQQVPLNEVPSQIGIPVVEVPATVATEAVKGLAFDSIIGESTTYFAVKEKNRSTNLIAAAKALDRKVIRPGEIVSFNNTVGPREPGLGYKDAYVIINGRYVQGIGGGVCQVSSTLYNAVLLGNLKVVERMPHAVAVSYVPAGQDATVNYPNIDFKFQNDTASLLYLRSEVKNGMLTLRILGKKSDKSVRIERHVEKLMNYKTVKRQDTKLAEGRVVQEQMGVKGLVVNTWKVVRDSTGKETRQFLSRDTYAPANRILRVGARGLS